MSLRLGEGRKEREREIEGRKRGIASIRSSDQAAKRTQREPGTSSSSTLLPPFRHTNQPDIGRRGRRRRHRSGDGGEREGLRSCFRSGRCCCCYHRCQRRRCFCPSSPLCSRRHRIRGSSSRGSSSSSPCCGSCPATAASGSRRGRARDR